MTTTPNSTDTAMTCVVCGESETDEALLEYCWGCNGRFHYNPTRGPGKDCGQAWIDDEEEGVQTFCNTCMERQRAEDQGQMQEIVRAAATGNVTPEMLAQIAQMLGGNAAPSVPPQASPFGAPFAASQFPGFSSQPMPAPAGVTFPGMERLADATIVIPPAAPAEDDAAPSEAGEPPRLAPSRNNRRSAQTQRRFRRIE